MAEDDELWDSTEEQADDALFERLMSLVPRQSVEVFVRRFFESQAREELRRSLGHPDKALVENEFADVLDPAEQRRLADEVKQMFEASPQSVLSQAFVNDEVEHVRNEIWRHWLNSLMLGLAQAGLRSLPIDDFIPRWNLVGVRPAQWDKTLSDLRQTFRRNVAMTHDDLAELTRMYFRGLEDALCVAPLATPGSYEFAVEPPNVVFRQVLR